FSTFPEVDASTGISIFIDSRITQVWPSATSSPSLTSIFQTVPVMCAFTLVAMDRILRWMMHDTQQATPEERGPRPASPHVSNFARDTVCAQRPPRVPFPAGDP